MISVCIATHNGGAYIKEQVDSILCQLGPYDEIIISDDGSNDDTLDIIQNYRDQRILLYQYVQSETVKHPHQLVCRNFENAIKHAKGDIIFLSDQDDIWLPNKVDVCLKDLEQHDLVLHDFKHIDEEGFVISDLHYNGTFRPRNYLLRAGKHYGCAIAFKRSVLDYALPFPKHLLLHDYWIGILAESLGNFYFEDMPLIKYRIHQQNTSVIHNPLWFMIGYRVNTLINVVFRVVQYKMGNHHYLNLINEE